MLEDADREMFQQDQAASNTLDSISQKTPPGDMCVSVSLQSMTPDQVQGLPPTAEGFVYCGYGEFSHREHHHLSFEVTRPKGAVQSNEDSREGHKDFSTLHHRQLHPTMLGQAKRIVKVFHHTWQSHLTALIRETVVDAEDQHKKTQELLPSGNWTLRLLNEDTGESLHIPTSHRYIYKKLFEL